MLCYTSALMIDASERNRILKKSSITGILINFIRAGVKVFAGLISGSVAILSDAVNNASDSLSLIVTVIGFELAKRKPTHSHPLGFGRIEYISALFVAIFVILTGSAFLSTSVDRILHPETVSLSIPMLILLLGTIGAKLFLWRMAAAAGKKIDSEALSASGADALSDVMITSVTIIAALIGTFTDIPIDGWAGLVVSLFIFYTGFRSVIETVSTIVGERPTKATVAELRKIISKHPPLSGGFDIQIHTYGPSRSIGTCNVEVPSTASAEEVFDAMTDAQEEILADMGIYMTFGMYAVNSSNPVVRLMKSEVLKVLKTVSSGVIGIHAFHIHFEDSRVHFDVVVDFTVTNYAQFRTQASKALEDAFPTYTFKFNIDPDYA